MNYLWRLLLVAGGGTLAAAVGVGLINHGACGAYLIPLSAAQSGVDNDIFYEGSCNRVDDAGIPVWSLVAATILIVIAAIVIRDESESESKSKKTVVRASAAAPQPARSAAVPSVSATNAQTRSNLVDGFERLGQLYQAGVLTKEEFIAAKTRLLS